MNKTHSSRKRRTEGQWAQIIQRYESSGQSSSEFCRREGLALSSLQRWRRQLGSARVPEFVELTSAAAPPAPEESGWSLDVTLPGGVSLQFRG